MCLRRHRRTFDRTMIERRGSPATASSDAAVISRGFVLVPFVTVLLSAWFDDEPLTGGLALGALPVLAGVYVGAFRPGGRPRRPRIPRRLAEAPGRVANGRSRLFLCSTSERLDVRGTGAYDLDGALEAGLPRTDEDCTGW